MEQIEFGENTISYDLKRSSRKSLGISVNHKGQLVVTAPEFVSLDKIESVLLKKKNWIESKLKEKSQNFQIQPARQFISGESVYLFGVQYYLKVIEDNCFKVKKDFDRLIFHMEDTSKSKEVITKWLQGEFSHIVNLKSAECLTNFLKHFDLPVKPVIKIRKMSKRWGSCTSDGVIHLNPMLVAAPIECIEYVIYHELAHLIEFDHGEEFYRVLERVCPGFKHIKIKLENKICFRG